MSRLSRWLSAGLLAVAPALAADITLSKTLAGPALSVRGQWATSQPLVFRGPLEGRIQQTRWFYRLNGPIPAGFQAQLCRGTVCIPLDSGRGNTGYFTDAPVSGTFRFSFRVLSGEAIRPQLRVISAGVTISYRQLSAAGQQSAPVKAGATTAVTSGQPF
ncbi:flagellar protein FlhE [Tatumella terrea]|uniref:Flagellar protein FlhE n=1 Tax=Tatumella terrea TaxID=419007 RepID=A0ABW1VVI4_9GAMM